MHVRPIQTAFSTQCECATELSAALNLQQKLCTESTLHTGTMQIEMWDRHMYVQTLPIPKLCLLWS